MLPPLRVVRAGLHRTTEVLACHLGGAPSITNAPAWSAVEWQLATAAAVAHGVSPLLFGRSTWKNPEWRSFLENQRDHVLCRHRGIEELLKRIDAHARASNIALMPLKGSALHALGLYVAGERPMADIDLLADESCVAAVTELLRDIGFELSFNTWRHRVFKVPSDQPMPDLGEHRNSPINIELHTRIQERLPMAPVDITALVRSASLQPGLNPYPSRSALMCHLLLHAAGNICHRGVRLIQLNDIATLATRMSADDWTQLLEPPNAETPWWALPPLRLTARYFEHAVPRWVLSRLASHCTALLRFVSSHQSLTHASCSGLWIQLLPGIEWARSIREACQYLSHRVRPGDEANRERADIARTQLWAQGEKWSRLVRSRQILVRLRGRVPRLDMLHVVRAAMASPFVGAKNITYGA